MSLFLWEKRILIFGMMNIAYRDVRVLQESLAGLPQPSIFKTVWKQPYVLKMEE